MTNSSVAVVILNWNGINLLKQFLPGVVENSKPYQVVLADNASTDESVAWTKAMAVMPKAIMTL
jgi:GT2 family glycosyltransferase